MLLPPKKRSKSPNDDDDDNVGVAILFSRLALDVLIVSLVPIGQAALQSTRICLFSNRMGESIKTKSITERNSRDAI